jgi:hypothetical protein
MLLPLEGSDDELKEAVVAALDTPCYLCCSETGRIKLGPLGFICDLCNALWFPDNTKKKSLEYQPQFENGRAPALSCSLLFRPTA